MPLIIESDPDKDAIFAAHYVRTKDAVAACSQAHISCPGYDMRDVAVYNLRRPETKRAIAAEEAKPPATIDPPQEITRESILTDLQTVYEKSLSAGDYNPAITAKKTQAQLNGWLDQNVTLTVKHDASSMTDAQLEQIVQNRLRGASDKAVVIDAVVTPSRGLGALTHNAKT